VGGYKVNEVECVADGVYRITEVHSTHRYLILGDQKALLLDTAYGFEDFRYILRDLTRMPIIVCNSHGDPDHALGNYLFSDVYMHPRDLDILKKNDNREFKQSTLDYRLTKEPELSRAVDCSTYLNSSLDKVKYHWIEEGYIFELGGRKLEVIHIPGHSPGSIALLDRAHHILFSGDTVTYYNIWYFTDSSLPFSTLLKTYQKLISYQKDIDAIFPAHGKNPIPNTVIDELIECIPDLLRNHENDELINTFIGPAFRHYYKNVQIMYSKKILEEALRNGL
jgi:hydroxyacylglutathione hydrolase